jgi:hypothetical protein
MIESMEDRDVKRWTDDWVVRWLSRVPGRRRRGPLAAVVAVEAERAAQPRPQVPRREPSVRARESLEHRLGTLPASTQRLPLAPVPACAAGVLVAIAGERSGEIHAFRAPLELRDGSILHIGESEFVFRSVAATEPRPGPR